MYSTKRDPSLKDSQRAQLAKQIKAYLDQGGHIKQYHDPSKQHQWPIKNSALPALSHNWF